MPKSKAKPSNRTQSSITSQTERENTKLNEVVFIMENNSCIIMREDPDKSFVGIGKLDHYEYKLKDEYKPNFLYPPPKCSKVKFIEKSPYEENCYYILSGEGALLYYSTEGTTSKLINYYPFDYFVVSIIKPVPYK